jgi:hypothetical protein
MDHPEEIKHPKMSEEDARAAIEHRDALLNVRAVLATSSGREFFKYLFKMFQVTELPDRGLEGPELFDTLGYLRAGNSVFKLVAEADAASAGNLLAQNEKERYAQIYKDAHIGQS